VASGGLGHPVLLMDKFKAPGQLCGQLIKCGCLVRMLGAVWQSSRGYFDPKSEECRPAVFARSKYTSEPPRALRNNLLPSRVPRLVASIKEQLRLYRAVR